MNNTIIKLPNGDFEVVRDKRKQEWSDLVDACIIDAVNKVNKKHKKKSRRYK